MMGLDPAAYELGRLHDSNMNGGGNAYYLPFRKRGR